MTSEIIQSDIDLTRHMLDQRCADPEIIRILGKRGIDLDRAVVLVDDLRHGRSVIPCFPLGYRIPPGPAGPGSAPLATASRPAAVRRRVAHRNPRTPALLEEVDSNQAKRVAPQPRRISVFKWAAVVLVLVALGVAAWAMR